MLKVLNISMDPVRSEPFHHIPQFFTEILLKGLERPGLNFLLEKFRCQCYIRRSFYLCFGTKPILQFLRSKQYLYEC